jgi:hypothetical protein
LANLLSISPNQTKFFPYVCLVPGLDFSAIPVSISAVFLTGRQTWQNVNRKRRLQRIQNVQEGKRHQKKETSSCFFLLFLEKFPTAEFLILLAETS